MPGDPFHEEIVERLKKRIDPNSFEDCACDLIRPEFPGVVPVRGGSDSGFDGAIADGQGVPFPLVSTTAKDVIGNLTRNLKSYLRDGGTRRSVVLATSRELSKRRRKNLEARARELG